ncbi:TIGR04222 domain-containing membrane protein [Streptomyces sp. AV19]|uniref:TIGR04222 domain-containing membrane protein n=1 Tax=Streptomyces sp. AV19 TaxID=2793068 RepID=UPI0018FEEAEA|nr:TIGR04222 domain-containing membrane protein [Streptomyces sp. AV19]MBH1937868.1 TIGR04222 domain-containing membrane protein [Streptomyces sp. AV19]MDG4536533.1 TIGR04222 domain-containing membrane protein [Streptomyces sp. AV19]
MTVVVPVTLLAVVAPALWTLWLWWRARHPGTGPSPAPDLLRAAYLQGGAGRLVDAVITRMWQDGRVTVRGGRLTVTRAVAHDAVERALLAQCGPGWAKSLKWLRIGLRRDAALEALHHDLVARGMLAGPRTWRLWRRAVLVQRVGLPVALVTALFVDAALFPGVLATAVPGLAVAIACRPRKRRIPWTAPGERLARRMRADGPWSTTDARLHPEGHAGVVAVHGTDKLADASLREEFRKANEADRQRRAGGGSSSSSSSSTYWVYGAASSCSVVVGASCDGGWNEAGWGDGGSSSGGSGDSGGSGCSSGSSCSSCSSSSCSS